MRENDWHISFNIGNTFSYYMGQHEVSQGVEGIDGRGEVLTDIATSFVILCGIYFPSVTGNFFPC